MKINTFLCRDKFNTEIIQMPINLTHLKKILPKDWASIIAEKHGVTADYVRKVMNGQREVPEIQEEIISLAGKHKQKLMAIAERAAAI